MNKFSLVSLVSFVFVALSAVACVGGPEDGNEAAAASVAGAAGSGGSSAGTGGTGGSGGSGGNADPCKSLDCSDVGDKCAVDKDGKAYCVNPCDAAKCDPNQSCKIVNKVAKCVDNGAGGSAGSGGSGGSSGGTAGTGGSGGSGGSKFCDKQCALKEHCEFVADVATCISDGDQALDIVPKAGCVAKTWDAKGPVAADANGEIHRAITVADAGYFWVTVNCGTGNKSDWAPKMATAASTGYFKTIKVNGQDRLSNSLICEDVDDPNPDPNSTKILVSVGIDYLNKCAN